MYEYETRIGVYFNQRVQGEDMIGALQNPDAMVVLMLQMLQEALMKTIRFQMAGFL